MIEHRPVRYALRLEPDLDALTFRGRLKLTTELESPGRVISLDAVDLTIHTCDVVAVPSPDAEPVSIGSKVNAMDGGIEIELDAEVQGTLEIVLEYTGEINDLMAGFYRSRYRIDGKEKFLAVTQFEERDARRAFPCVDRPAYKAAFDIEIIAPAGHIAIANTPTASTTSQDDGAVLYTFEPTPLMSTYLVFFGVGPFDIVEDTSWRIPIRVAVSPGKGPAARQSLTYARQSVAYLEEFTGVAYPLDKLDSIGVTDFAYGAMENFGAIVYRENYLLYYADSTTRRETERMMGIAAHEIAHQWFGDLVSPADWRYVWLNEAFATYFGNAVTGHWYPEWRTMEQFVLGATGAAMSRDGLPRSVPIELESDEAVEIDASTAPIIYSKGASVLRMIRGYFGDDAFQAATAAFLKAYSYKAADTAQFLDSFGGALQTAAATDRSSGRPDAGGSAAGVSAAELLQGWITQPGFPLLRVSRDGGALRLTQERFSYFSDDSLPASNSLWTIPVAAHTVGATPQPIRATMSTRELHVDLPGPDTVVKVNSDQTGYYRVFYESEADWNALGQAARDGHLSALDRYGLISDLGAFVSAGLVTVKRYLSYLESYYANESEYVVLARITDSLTGLYSLLNKPARVAQCVKVVLGRFADSLLAEPSDDEPYQNVLLRDSILWALYATGADPSVRDSLVATFAKIRSGTAVHPDLVPLAVQIATSEDGNDGTAVQWMKEQIASADVSEGRTVQLISALSAVKNETLIPGVLDFIMTEVPVRNRLNYFRGIGGNTSTRGLLWDWFVENFKTLAEIHPYHLGSTIASIVPFAGLGREQEVRSFFDRYRADSPRISVGVLDVSLDRLETNRRILEREA